MAIKIPLFPPLRLHSPFWQNWLIGCILGLTAGLYGAINLLGAGGGRPNSAQTVQTVNATLCAVFALSSAFAGSVLNTIGPCITALLGIVGYAVYVGSLWYFDRTGNEWFPILAAVLIGLSAGLIVVTMSSISMSYSEEQERGSFITITFNLQGVGMAIGGIIPLIINRKSQEAAGVPIAVYISIIALMGFACVLALGLRPAAKVIREDGTQVATIHSRGYVEELKANMLIFKDWKLLLMIPAFLPSECYLVYNGSVNAYHNDLRARSLLSFCSVMLQIPAGYGLQKILDHKTWTRRKRAFIGLAAVGIPMTAAWIWEMARVRNYDRSELPTKPLDWSDPNFGAIFVLFCLNWVSCALFQCLILYFLSSMTNSPRTASNYAGAFRTFMAGGEAICFGVDSIGVPFIKEAGVLFAFYFSGLLIFTYFAAYHITPTQYLVGEEGVVIPVHVVEELKHDGLDLQDVPGAGAAPAAETITVGEGKRTSIQVA
ncbi:hypothetical protein A1O3_00029 [Capronia epimyces CBS 606.96]|uniref:Major facilitator superfamily (MFS) profile domain-containing protein n=1 Tax=Capronia epimyces CBS 606.96 TaxID=1182542 RepID=W9YQF6_9EURO|nr:uncharacterized protein A1O3_00029 [Capronia epimyces CBS 606.96]EXJ91481.1 hypothetical protein A1O3_00029 [Capronia epimyces CBS 606.96]